MASQVGFVDPATNGFIVQTTSSAFFTVPNTVKRINISHISLFNYSNVPVDVTLWILQNGQTESDEFKVFEGPIAPLDGPPLNLFGRGVESGGSIRAIASVASSVSLSMTRLNIVT